MNDPGRDRCTAFPPLRRAARCGAAPAPRVRGALLLAGAILTAAGCASPLWRASEWGPPGERPGDLGPRVAEERLRRVDELILARYRVITAPPTPSTPGEGVRADGPARADAGDDAGARGPERPAWRWASLREGGEVDLTIQAARAAALEHNLTLRAALVDPLIAGEALDAERARFEAVFVPTMTFSSTDTPALPGGPEQQTDQFSAGAGVSVPLRTGGRASVNLLGGVTGGDSPFIQDPLYSAGASFSIVQPLLRGAGRSVATASIRLAALREQAASAQTKLAVITELARVERAYWRLYAARRELEVRQQQYEVALQQLERARRRVDAQQLPEVEVIRAESGLAERLEAIINAETAVLVTQRELRRVMNAGAGPHGLDPLDEPGLLRPVSEPVVQDYALDARALVEVALAGRMELLEAELGLLADAVNIDLARNATLPQLDLTGSYAVNGVGTGAGSTLARTGRADVQSYSVGVQGSIPLGNAAAEADLRRAVLTRLQRLATRHAREQLVRQEVLDAVDRVRSGWQRILASRQATILAGRTFEAEQRQFDAGRRTSTDVLDAAARLAEAQSAEIRALTDYQIALVDLAVATGTVLGHGGVEWRPAAPQPGLAPRPPTTREATP
jgi:outer membrane protein